MKLNFFSKKNLLDEMQEQTMRKIESRGCYVFFFGLVAALVIQKIMGAPMEQLTGEGIILTIGCLYMLEESIRHGLWERHATATAGTNLLVSFVAAAVLGGLTFVRNAYWSGALGTAIFGGILCFVALQWTMTLALKRRKTLDNKEEEEQDEHD